MEANRADIADLNEFGELLRVDWEKIVGLFKKKK
jgi:hypothetical protein